MDRQRVRGDGTRRRPGTKTDRGGLIPVALVGIIALAAGLWFYRSGLQAPRASVAVPGAGSPNQTHGPVANHEAGGERLLLSPEDIRTLQRDQRKKPRYDGSIMGWRIGPYAALVAEGADDPDPSLSCDARQAGAETASDLDFSIGYLPTDLNIGTIRGPMKWLCGDEGFSVSYNISVEGKLGVGQIGIDRFVQTERVVELDVPNDSVEEATVNGTPAILVHPADDASGLGLGVVIVIEDDIGPELTILRVFSDDAVPFAELIKIAESVK